MIKIKRADGGCNWVHGTRALAYKGISLKATGRKRWCKTVAQTVSACAYASLRAVLSTGYDLILYSVEDAERRDVIVNIPLPPCMEDAVKLIEDTCIRHGSIF